MKPRIEVWDFKAFARHLYEHGKGVVRAASAEQVVAANFVGADVVEVAGMAPWHVCVVGIDGQRVDIRL